ncbi:helix-turn-helix domain-containing protein [Rikenella microfusus]|uniref:helix-turn-helix domain-containing protein n=1 Tax=Rikenella microfusus TaxID=28139 RepID=UPI003A945064
MEGSRSKKRTNPALTGSIAQKLKQIRQEKGLSQEFVYLETEIHVGRVESGKVNISVVTLSILCDYYGVTLEEFFRGICEH